MSDVLDPDALADEMARRHGAHTVLLYGSRARGDASERSDVDVIAVRPSGGAARDLRPWRGWALDVHVHDEAGVEALLSARSPDLRDAIVLRQRDGLGDRIVAAVRARLAEPPPALSPADAAALWAWGDKMRARVAHPDPLLAAYHRATLLVESLPAWAEVRRRWFHGGKAALASLAVEDPTTRDAYEVAARPGADVADFLRLLDAVFDARLPRPAPCGPSAP